MSIIKLSIFILSLIKWDLGDKAKADISQLIFSLARVFTPDSSKPHQHTLQQDKSESDSHITNDITIPLFPFVCNGANTMSAGINAVSPEIVKGQYVWIREENHQKPLGVGKALLDAKEILSSTKGKAIEALHYIGDKIWEYGVKD